MGGDGNRANRWWTRAALAAGLAAPASLAADATRPLVLPPVVIGSSDDKPAPKPKEKGTEAPAPELSVDWVVQQVLDRNPTVAQMTSAWQAAQARYPQVRSLEDPTFGATIGPASIGSRDVDFAYRLEASQRLPYPGKRELRGESALAEARAANSEIEATRLQLAEAARTAVYDYYLAERGLEVNREGLRLLRDFRQNAETRYRTGQVPQQDVLRADLELGRQRERTLALERAKKVAAGRINTLMHLPPDSPLPPPPKEVKTATGLPEGKELRELALARRPDLQSALHRVAAGHAAVALAVKEYKPDFEVMAAYDAFWQPRERDLRAMLGVRLNLPVYKEKRHAAVAEAQARLAGRVAELHRLQDQVAFEVHQSVEQVRESEEAVRLYEKTVLPAARESVKSAQSAYVTGKVPFLTLIEAQQALVEVQDRFYETAVEALRRRAALERVLGGPVPAVPPSKDGR